MIKICRVCRVEKPLEEFNKNHYKSDGLDSRCKGCSTDYYRKYFAKNKEAINKNSNTQRKKNAQILKSFVNDIKNKPCVDCGVHYAPWQMDFDHIPGATKKFTIAKEVGQGKISIKTLSQEIAKCDLVCANCHRDRTYKRSHQKEYQLNSI